MTPVWLTDTLTRDLGRAVHYTLLWGFEGIVLRTLGQGERVPEINETKVRNRLAAEDVPLAAIEPGLFEGAPNERALWMNDLARLPEIASFCRRMDCRTVIVSALPGGPTAAAADALRRAGKLAASGGLRLAVRNEGEGRASGEELAALLEEVDHPAVTACWDPAGAAEAGASAPAGQAALQGRVGMLMVRATQFPAGGLELPWAALLADLARGGFAGPVCLDMTGLASKEGLRISTALIYALRDAARASG
jgi:sugar phosphate isomerase/epimerase